MTEGICPTCLKGFEPDQGKRFAGRDTYHDWCWPFVCCSECGYEPGADGTRTECYCISPPVYVMEAT